MTGSGGGKLTSRRGTRKVDGRRQEGAARLGERPGTPPPRVGPLPLGSRARRAVARLSAALRLRRWPPRGVALGLEVAFIVRLFAMQQDLWASVPAGRMRLDGAMLVADPRCGSLRARGSVGLPGLRLSWTPEGSSSPEIAMDLVPGSVELQMARGWLERSGRGEGGEAEVDRYFEFAPRPVARWMRGRGLIGVRSRSGVRLGVFSDS